VLMFLNTLQDVHFVLEQMKSGTRLNGYNYISVSTDISEVEIDSNKKLPVDIELPFTITEAESMLLETYENWRILKLKKKPYKEIYTRDNKKVLWRTTFLSLVVQKISYREQ